MVQNRVLLFQKVQAHPAVLAQRVLRLMQGQVREKIIPGLRVTQIAAHDECLFFIAFGRTNIT